MNFNDPDRWVILEMSENPSETVRKVFAGWYGGYCGSDSWKLSSGIVEVKESEHHFEFINVSGSVYKCRKIAYGMSGLMGDMYKSWLDNIKSIQGASINIIEQYDMLDNYQAEYSARFKNSKIG
jgi:hypothetical protein